MIGVRKRGRIRVAELGELQNPSPFRVRRGSLYLVHTFAATSRLRLRYSVPCVSEYNLYKLDVMTLDSRNTYLGICKTYPLHIPCQYICLF